MLINWINVTIYAEQWPKLGNLLSQAERTICEIMERDSATSSSSSYSSTSAIQPKTPTSKNYKELVQTCRAKISAVIGLAKMQERNFRQAAEKFITVCFI
jgi:hypothetical protein